MTDETKPASENKPELTESEATSDKPATNNATASAKQQQSEKTATTKSATGAYLVSVIAIGLVVALGYYGYLRNQAIQQQISTLQQSSQSYQVGLNRIQQDALQLNAELLEKITQSEAQVAKDIQGITNQVLSMNEVMTNITGQKETGWLVDQAYYLLKIANNRIMFMQDAGTALYLLNEADELLGQIDDPNLFATRKKLSEDRQILNAVPKLDTTGLAIRVSALQSRIGDLRMIQVMASEEADEAADQPEPQAWYEHLLHSLGQLSDQIFTVRQHGSGYTPILSETDEQQLRFAIMMTLQTIQYAVLYQNDDLYQANLLQLKSRLTNYFDNQDPAVQTLLLELNDLLSIQVGHDPFASLGSLSALSTFIQQRDNPSAQDAEIKPEPKEPSPSEDTETTEELKLP